MMAMIVITPKPAIHLFLAELIATTLRKRWQPRLTTKPATERRKPLEGYSWTSLFFGAFHCCRATSHSAQSIHGNRGTRTGSAGFPTWLSSGIVGGVWGLFYNDVHFNRLRRAGFEIVTSPATQRVDLSVQEYIHTHPNKRKNR